MRNTGDRKGWTAILSGLFAALLSAPAWGAIPAHPGMLNYVEGQASISGQQVTAKSVGSAEVEKGQVLETGAGKAEMLLTPGVFLRLGDNSAARLDSDGLTHTSVELLHGQAMVEANDIHRGNNIQLVQGNATSTVEKEGLYRFNADTGQVAVYDGKLRVNEGDSHVDVKKGKQTSVAQLHTENFDTKQTDDLYNWSDLRSRYLSEASVQSARTYIVNSGGWAGGGWYWNPYFSYYSWLPGDGLFYSPFGYGYFSPWAIYGGYPRVISRGAGFYGHAGDQSGRFGRQANSFVGRAPANFGVVSSGFGRSTAAPAFQGGGMRTSGFGGGGVHGGGRR